MNSTKLHRIFAAWIILGVVVSCFAALAPASPLSQKVSAAPPIDTSNSTHVAVGIYIISMGNYDFAKGTYVMDFYLWFSYDTTNASANFTISKFELMNKMSVSKDVLSDETDSATGVREVWYRVQASLYSETVFKDYPYDTQSLTIVFEDAIYPMQDLIYEAADGTDISSEVKIPGYIVGKPVMSFTAKEYSFGETYSRGVLSVKLTRETASTSVKTLLPPIVFCIVSGLSFMFKPDKIGQRVGFGTSMLISAVMFHLSQISSLPPTGSLMIVDKIMISTYAFLAASLLVTAFMSYLLDYKTKERAEAMLPKVNIYGLILSVALPFVTFGAMML